MIVADGATCLEVSGSGEVLEPSDGVHGAQRGWGRPGVGWERQES
jgi:ATP-dependent protease HslVU (ClpYQ) peptidase subunit